MKSEYDFTNAIKNPYTRSNKEPITVRLNPSTVQYFKDLAEEAGLKYQSLINSYLDDCARRGLKPTIKWEPPSK